MVLVLLVMLFVRFAKPLQWRHWDMLLLFLLTIPMLFLRDSQERRDDVLRFWCPHEQFCPMILMAGLQIASPMQGYEPVFTTQVGIDEWQRRNFEWMRAYGIEQHSIWRSYFWLLIVSALLLIRSLLDLGLEQRSEFRSNVTTGAMLWLLGVMMMVMIVKSFVPTDWRGAPQPQRDSIAVASVKELLTNVPVTAATSYKIFALSCHALIVIHLVLIGWMHFRHFSIGVAAALLYLLMPYTAVLLLNTSQVVASLCVVMAITWFRWPMLAGLFLGLGTGFNFFPIILVPAWMGFYYQRGHRRFLAAFLAVLILFGAYLTWDVGLARSWESIWSMAEWQAWTFALKPKAEGLWNTISLHRAYRIPLFIAFVALMFTSAFWPHPKHLGQLISWSATLILGVQFWYADAGGSYILWYLPLVILQIVRPTLTNMRAVEIVPEKDRLRQFLQKVFRRKPSKPVVLPGPSQQPPTALAG